MQRWSRVAAGARFFASFALRNPAVLQVRRLRCSLGVLPSAAGSAIFELGNTRALAAVYGPREVTLRSDALHDRCTLRCEVTQARC